jgi:PEGA domain
MRTLPVSLYKKIIGSAALIALVMVLGMTNNAEAQRRGGRVVVAPRVASRVVVVGGGYYRPYFYDPFWFDPWYGFSYGYQYPWGPYGYPPYRAYRVDPGASLRLEVKPKDAEVYVDGYYAGIVDDFDGMFQRLSVTPGEHDIELYLDGYRTVHQKVYLTPRKTFNVKYAMERLAAGEQPEPRPQPAEPPPGPQAGAPRGGEAPPMPQEPPPVRTPGRRMPPQSMPPPTPPQAPRDNPRSGTQASGYGTLAIRVQPGDAEVMIDGEMWRGPAGQDRLMVEVSEGPHTVQISKSGYRTYVTDVQVRRGETAPLNVSLRSQDEQR